MTLTVPIGKPRHISPELVEIGDDVSVEITKPDKGIRTTTRGVVAKRHVHGAMRYFTTLEGGTIFSYEPGKRHGLVITLYGRAEVVQDMLFDNLTEIKDRLSA